MPISPYSLTTTAVFAPSGLSSSARIRVVFPEPKKPVTAMTGSRGPRARRCRRPKSGASFPPNSASGPASEVHFEGIEASDMPIDGVDDLPVVDKDIIYLYGPAGRPLGGRGHEVGHFSRLIGIGRVICTQAAIEVGGQDNAVRFPRVRLGQVLIEVVRAIARALPHVVVERRQRAGRNRHRIGL